MKQLALNILICSIILLSCNNNRVDTKIKAEKNDPIQNSDSSKNAAMLERTLAFGKASVSGEIAEIDAYVNVILDTSTTKTIKYRAFRVLHDRYPNYFISIKDVRNSANKVEDALIRRAQIKTIKEKITDLNEEKAASK